MTLPWIKRKERLDVLLNSQGDENEDGLSLDRLLHGQAVIGTNSKTAEIDDLRFGDRDLAVAGTLEYGQFGVIDVVNCRLDGRVYVRKSTEKRFAQKTRDQCSPQNERDILLRATLCDSRWAPHLFCAYQTPTHLNLVMSYAEGGTLWDVLESSPLNGRVSESDVAWWAPQIVSAIHWCHSQNYVHRDIKPHNFVLSRDARILLIDFGSAAALLPPSPDGSQQVPKRNCIVPCGTCDYISPEILQTHEEALVALEMEASDEEVGCHPKDNGDEGGYGLETDWWSMGAMLYEMIYGVAPFFAKDIRTTYSKILDHEKPLGFDETIAVSGAMKDLLRRLLTRAESRLGRTNVTEITEHPFFENTNWASIHSQPAPASLHLPQFSYAATVGSITPDVHAEPTSSQSYSRPFAFSALFQSSPPQPSSGKVALSVVPDTVAKSVPRPTLESYIGFSWGPTTDTYPRETADPSGDMPVPVLVLDNDATPRPKRVVSSRTQKLSDSSCTRADPMSFEFATPMRTPHGAPHSTLPRTSTIRRTTARRDMSDREAMKQLVDCIGLSARKKVLESGRKPRLLALVSRPSMGALKSLRFGPEHDDTTVPVSAPATFHEELYEMSESESEPPPSPSPSPRPGSAMSIPSRRSQTPTITASFAHFLPHRSSSGTVSSQLTLRPGSDHVDRRSKSSASADGRDLEARHSKLMADIGEIERRMTQLSMRVSGEG